MVQHTQTDRCNMSHKQTKRQSKHMIISLDAEKAFGKIQHLFMISPGEEFKGHTATK